jgi:hypothetical protein
MDLLVISLIQRGGEVWSSIRPLSRDCKGGEDRANRVGILDGFDSC